jgi:hypothetical protein
MAQIALDFSIEGTFQSLTKSARSGDVVLSKEMLAVLKTVAGLSCSEKKRFVCEVARGAAVDLEGILQMMKREDGRVEGDNCDADLAKFVDSLSVHSMTIEAGSLYLNVSDGGVADRFRSLEKISRSAVCAALFSTVCDKSERKFIDSLLASRAEWREFPSYKRIVPARVADAKMMDAFTVKLPKSMSNARFKATARSLASNLHFLQRQANCSMASWILYFDGNWLNPLKLGSPSGLGEALERTGWESKEDGC